MFKKIAWGLLVVAAGFAGFIAVQPDSFQIERTGRMQASPEVVFAVLNDLARWDEWSPWNEMDPNMKKSLSETTVGQGARYAWEGNSEVGSGTMTIRDSERPTRVTLDLAFQTPFEAENVVQLSVTPQGPGCEVSWALSGNNDFMGKAFSLFMDMDDMVGKDFERGLAKLKAVTEADEKRIAAEQAQKKMAEERARRAAEVETAAAEGAQADPG